MVPGIFAGSSGIFTQFFYLVTDDEETRNMWNYKFELLYDVIVLKNTIKTKITITNTGKIIKERNF